VNEWGFKEYRLDIYGGLDRMPFYTVECQELLAAKSLRGYVTMKGYGNPKAVLEDTWVFLNSSISEGLPLAIGEAALTGAPIVCTDVGATFQVLTDPDDPKKRYGTVTAPNDPRALARGQIALLAVMDEWEEYGEDKESPGPLPQQFTPRDVERITQRMKDKTEQRRKLGLQLRKIVQKSFSGDRYLREHEQMLWIGKHKNENLRRKAATDANEVVIDMLGDMLNGLEVREYRPSFMRYVSGFSAFNSALGSEVHISGPSTASASNVDDNEKRFETYHPGPSNLASWDRSSSVYSEKLEKGKFTEVGLYDSDAE
jgi:Glycosyl transferases group 1